jgi:predicted aspartyl protease
MGHVFRKALLSAEREQEVNLLVDTKATCSLVSPRLADQLGVARFPKKETVTLANGQTVEADIGLVRIQIGDRAVATPALIAECDEPQPGVEALEALGLSVDPASGELEPTRGYAVRLGGLR